MYVVTCISYCIYLPLYIILYLSASGVNVADIRNDWQTLGEVRVRPAYRQHMYALAAHLRQPRCDLLHVLFVAEGKY